MLSLYFLHPNAKWRHEDILALPYATLIDVSVSEAPNCGADFNGAGLPGTGSAEKAENQACTAGRLDSGESEWFGDRTT